MKLLIRIAGVAYTALLFYIFFLARRRPRPSLFHRPRSLNLIPIKSKLEEIQIYGSQSFHDKWNFLTDLFGNIALFIPLPFFLAVIFNVKSYGKMILIACAASICVECTQFVFSIGVADIDDVILNTLGAVIGLLVLSIAKKIVPSVFPPTL